MSVYVFVYTKRRQRNAHITNVMLRSSVLAELP